ncbi:hypothetical protein GEMRC1_007848 [Eukaryota sp. GEM-RC1]
MSVSPSGEEFSRRLSNLREVNTSLRNMVSRFESASDSPPRQSPQYSPSLSPFATSSRESVPDDESVVARYLAQQKKEYSQNIARVALQSKSEISELQQQLALAVQRAESAERLAKDLESQNKFLVSENSKLKQQEEGSQSKLQDISAQIQELSTENQSLTDLSNQCETHIKKLNESFDEEKSKLLQDFEDYEAKYTTQLLTFEETKRVNSTLKHQNQQLSSELTTCKARKEKLESDIEHIRKSIPPSLLGSSDNIDTATLLSNALSSIKEESSTLYESQLQQLIDESIGLLDDLPQPLSLKSFVESLGITH